MPRDCQQITQTAVALEIVQIPGDGRLQQLFHCIYRLFHESFLSWVVKRFANNPDKEALREDAKDAFQNGLMAFYHKAQDKSFSIKGSLKTTLYSFGLLQLLAAFKKRKKEIHCTHAAELHLLFEDAFQEAERQQLLNEKEVEVVKALNTLPTRLREILLMKFSEKLKSIDIAGRLHVSAGHVDNEVAKAYRQLRQILTAKPLTPNNAHGINQ